MNTGGPAFPGPYVTEKGGLEVVWKQGGMTLRDYFAAKAMNGILETALDWFPTGRKADAESLEICKDLARDSYAIADAMLKAREQ